MKNSKNVKFANLQKKHTHTQFGNISPKKHIDNERVHCIGMLKGELWLGCGLHQRGSYHMHAHLL